MNIKEKSFRVERFSDRVETAILIFSLNDILIEGAMEIFNRKKTGRWLNMHIQDGSPVGFRFSVEEKKDEIFPDLEFSKFERKIRDLMWDKYERKAC